MQTETHNGQSARATAPCNPSASAKSLAARKLAIDLFQSVAGTLYQDDDSKWNAVLAFLNLPLCYQPAVQLALADGRWKQASDPKAYVATVAYRRALKENLLANEDSDEIRGRSRLEMGPVASFVPVGRNAAGESYNYDDQVDQLAWLSGDFDDYEEPLRDRVPDWLYAGGRYGRDVNWARVAEYAVRKKSMTNNVAKVLHFMTAGMSREIAIETAFDKEEREAIGAAWKWVDRNWESRIVPLFHLDESPAPVVKKPSAGKSKGRLIPPWEVLHRVCGRELRISAKVGL